VAAVGLTVVLILQTGTWVPPAAAGTDAPAESKAEDQSRAPVAPASEPSGPQQASFSDAFERLYFTTARYNPHPAVPFSSEWDDATNAGRYRLSETPLNTVDGSHGQPHGSTVHNRLHRQFLYRLPEPGRLEGYVRAFLRVQTRSGVGINESLQDMISQMTVRVVSADGTVVRGTALAAYNPASSAGETKWDAWALRSRKFPASGSWDHPVLGAALDAVDYQAGDYLVVEIGLRNFTVGTTTGGSTRYNDKAAADLPHDQFTTINLRSWIEFSPPGLTDEQLLGHCASGHTTCPWRTESDPVNTATGNYVSNARDIGLPGRGLPFELVRTYNSLAYQAPAGPLPSPNLVRFPHGGTASYTASRQYDAAYTPPEAADGITGNTSATYATWAVSGWVPGDWWQVTWSEPQSLDRIVLCDRRTGSWYFGSSGRITFSDGSTVNWSGLPNDCGSTGQNPLTIEFARKTGITSFRVIGDAGGFGNAGLAEVEAYDDVGAFEADVRNQPSAFGAGWTHNYAVRLEIDASGRVTFHAEDGSQLLFYPTESDQYLATPGVHSTLTKTPSGYSLLRRDQVTYEFDATGTLTVMADRNGNQLTFSYTGGQLTTITDTVGRTISLTYTDGRISALAAPPNRTIAYGYDALKRLTTVTDARGKLWTYTYDAQSRLESISDPNDHTVVTNEYGPDGRISAQTDARGKRGTFAWDPATETSTYTDARGKAWIDDYESNVLQSRTDPLSNDTTYAYNADFNLTAVTDPRGKTTTQTWDTAGNLLTRTAPAPLSYVQTWTYTAKNDVDTYIDGRNHTTDYTYDPAGNLITITAPEGAETEFGRDPAGTGLLVSLTDPRDKVTTFSYDAEANLTSTITPLGNTTTMAYDSAGRLTSVVDPRGNVTGADPADYTTTFTYNATDHLLTATDPLGNGTTNAYDDAGNLTSVTDPNNHATSYGYDAANKLTSVTDAATKVTAYAYDDAGNLTARTDANDHVTTYAYDDANRLTSTTDPLDHVWSLTYDPVGNVATRTDANDKTTTYTWDAINRLTGITYADPSTPAVTFAHDANSNRTSMTDGAGTETAVFDDLDRMTSVTRGGDTFSYGFDLAGNITSSTYPGQSAQTWTYDDDGRLATANGATYGYDPAANLLTVATPDGLTARHTWDRAGRLLEVAHTGATATLSRFTYALDAAGNRTAMTSREGTVTYRYDVLDRLSEACWSQSTCPGGAPATPLACLACIGGLMSRPTATVTPPSGETYRSYTYDPVGNRLTEASDAGTTTYAYNAADRLTSVTAPGQSAVSYTFDNNGNQTDAGADTFAWDLADRLVSATVGGATETYTWAGDGRRLSASSGGATTNFLWDQAFGLPQLALERDGSGSLLRSYRYGLDLLSQTAGSSTAWYHHDGLGSVSDLTDATGASSAWSEFYPFGETRLAGSGSGAPAVQPFSLTGEQLDAVTGMYHLRARQYDPATGRFLSIDPVPTAPTDPAITAYAYVSNRPTVQVDPSGRCPFCVLGAIGGVVGGAIGGVSYAMSAGDDFSVGGLLGSTASGAVAGAVVAISAPIGGTIAASLGASSTGVAAVAATAGINFAGGAAGYTAGAALSGDPFSVRSMLGYGFLNAGTGMIGNAVFPLRGVVTMSQLPYFAPRSFAAVFGGGVNASLAWRNALLGGFLSTWGAAAHEAASQTDEPK
jgi:RHS repeat-associated protein